MKIAYLSSYSVLPENPARRPDAYEHDLQFECLSAPFLQNGHVFDAVQWDRSDIAWEAYDTALIGAVWDYTDKAGQFLDFLTGLEARGIRVQNPVYMVRWNSRKTYLKELEARGVPCIPTLWLDCPGASDLQNAFDRLEADNLVVKRQVGAGAGDQIRIQKGDELRDYPFAAMVQPFMPSIQSEGEFSFIMIGGQLSHALLKTAQSGDYRIQSAYGGKEVSINPTSDDLKSAYSVMEALRETPLYARVDMIRGDNGQLVLMELELIEPYLYPEQSSQLGVLYYRALVEGGAP